jgi:N6-L-threonylcarbamoyladenine synthase
MRSDLILGIETSCDETAAAVLEGGRTIRSNVVASQAAVHAPYGGVVPELASRRHLEAIVPTVRLALERAGVGPAALGAIAVTQGPGLVGSLLVGLSYAKAAGYALGRPVIPVNHLEGHIHAGYLEHPDLAPPFVALVASGGHTHLYAVRGPGVYARLGRTRDDAAGEAFDKVAKLLGLGYPGGPAIERAARAGDPAAEPFPLAWFADGGCDFSFSGLKTAVVHRVRQLTGEAALASEPSAVRRPPSASAPEPSASSLQHPAPSTQHAAAHLPPQTVANLAAGFQAAAVEMLVRTTLRAARRAGAERVLLTGGVACNGRLREALAARAGRAGLAVVFPSPALCTDNAAMIAAAGHARWARGERAGLDCNARAHFPLGIDAREAA